MCLYLKLPDGEFAYKRVFYILFEIYKVVCKYFFFIVSNPLLFIKIIFKKINLDLNNKIQKALNCVERQNFANIFLAQTKFHRKMFYFKQ